MHLSVSRLVISVFLIMFSQVSFSSNHHAGATLGALSVDGGGGANYAVDLQVPPGTAGMQPSLSLNYSSNSGNGQLGVGWVLGGLSAITRCPASLDLDGYKQGVALNNRDRYCLDGQRLVAINGTYGASGTEYRTQKNSYTKITSYGQAGSGPAYFEVRSKSGQVSIYGENNRTYCSGKGVTGDSRNEAQGKSDVLVWAIARIEDSVGNYMRFCYHEDNNTGEFRIGQIDYTGNANKSLSPFASVNFSYEKRTDKSTHYVKGSKVTSEYRLTEIQTKANGLTARTYKLKYRYSAGDAKSSLLTSLQECGADGECKLSSSFGWKDSVKTPTFGKWARWGSNIWMNQGGCNVGDINRDGLDDLICATYNFMSNSNSFAVTRTGSFDVPTIADVNGDNYLDFITLDYDGTSYYVQYGGANGFSSKQYYRSAWNAYGPGDHNGDGRATFFGWSDFPYSEVGSIVDVDGDGLADTIAGDTDTSQMYVRLSTVTGFAQPVEWSYSLQVGGSGGDVDGDGLPEFFGGPTGLISSNGKGFDAFPVTFEAGGEPVYAPFGDSSTITNLADVNGDGLSDLVTIDMDQYGIFVALAKQPEPDLMTTITDGLGDKITVEYTQTDDTSVYQQITQQGQLAYPLSPLRSKMNVVKKYSIANGLGGSYSFTYKYEDGLVHRKTYGFLGFKKVTVTDSRHGIKNITTYSQDFQNQLQGFAVLTETRLSNNTLVERSATTWKSTALPETSFDKNKRFIIHKQSTTDESYKTSGGLISRISTSYEYDSYGNATKITVSSNDGYSKISNNTYTNSSAKWHLGRLINAKVTNITPFETKYRESAFSYDTVTGLLKTETVEPNRSQFKTVKTYTYDGYGNKVSVSLSASGLAARTTSTQYDARGQFPIKTTNAIGQSETYVWDPKWGVKTKLTGPNNLSTKWFYDSLGRQTKETRADGNSTTITYNVCETGASCQYGSPLWITKQSTGSVPTTTYFDPLGREVRSETIGFDGRVIVKKTTYDLDGRAATVSQLHFDGDNYGVTTYTYDQLGRVTVEKNPDNSITRRLYDGLTLYYVNSKCQVKVETKNSQGQKVEVGNGQLSTCGLNISDTQLLLSVKSMSLLASSYYVHDAFGNLTSTIDNKGNGTTMSYDIIGRHKVSMNDLDMGYWQYKYNAYGELIWQKDAEGQGVTMTYDKLGRLIKRIEPEGTSTWVYDTAAHGIGKLHKSYSTSNVTQINTYDTYGRASKTSTIIDGNTFDTSIVYDSVGRVKNKHYPSGVVVGNVYNTYGYLHKVKNIFNNIVYWEAKTVDARGKVTSEYLGNGLTTNRNYNPDTGRLEGISTGNGGSIQLLTYKYDTIGNMTERQDLNQLQNGQNLKETFTFDSFNRMTSSAFAGNTKTYTYDSIGNITYKTGVGSYKYTGTSPHAVTSAGGVIYSYNNNGNMTSGDGRSITYTSFNKPLTVSKGSTTNTYTYDVSRNRIKKISLKNSSTTTTYYMGKGYEKIYKSSGVQEHKHYISAGGTTVVFTKRDNTTQSTLYLHKDHLGSTDAITNETGVRQERNSFDAWGARRNANWTDTGNFGLSKTSLSTRGFTGHEMDDEIGLINMNARLYDAKLGRFLTPDTFVQFPYSTQGMNRYTYVNNNPISYTDPTGHFLKRLFKGIKRFVKRYGRAILQIAGGILAGPIGVFLVSAAYGDIKGGILGMMTAGMFGMVGELNLGPIAKVVAHGAVGATGAMLQKGGSWKSGFISAAFTASLSRTKIFEEGKVESNVFKAAIIGGVGSRLGGGKFANGAVTGAFSRLFNHELHESRKKNAQKKYEDDAKFGKKLKKWVEKIGKGLNKYFSGGKVPSLTVSVAGKLGGVVNSTGTAMLNTEMPSTLMQMYAVRNYNHCDQCIKPDDWFILKGYMQERPPNIRNINRLFINRGHKPSW